MNMYTDVVMFVLLALGIVFSPALTYVFFYKGDKPK
jgi:hypothetical protein